MAYKNEDEIECVGCEFRSRLADLAFVHTRCSIQRPCTGNKYWEPDNCSHCSNLDTILKVLNGPGRLVQLGKIKGLLNEVKRKVRERKPNKDWEYGPSFEFKFRKLNFFQTIHNEQSKVESSVQASTLTTTSPLDMDILQLDTDDE